MDIKRKLEIILRDIKSVSRHDDEDAVVVKAALDAVIGYCNAEKAVIDTEIQAKIAATLA